MKKIDRRKVRNITEQTTRKALNEQQLNEINWGRLGSGLWNGVKKLFGRGEKAVANMGNGTTRAMVPYGTNVAKNVLPGAGDWVKAADAMKFGRTAGMRGLLGGAALGGLGGYALGSASGSNGQSTPNPNLMPPGSMQGGAPYPGYGSGYGGGYDPYAGYGGGYGGGYSDPYAGYGGGYSDPYAGYGGYSGSYGGGSAGGMDPMMMYLMQQNGGSGGYAGGGSAGGMDPMMMYLLQQGGGNIDPMMMMMMYQ